VYIAPAHDAALSEAEESFMRQFRRVGSQMASSVNTPGVSGARAQIGAELAAITWDEVVHERVIVGSPEDCVAQLRRFEQALGLTEVVAEFNAGELISPERIARSLDLFSEQVIPQFGKS
jgi:alkanesulfonate monooxygenase SsuD/methylene tetrahydromethanopterin reductase-like flavin-dependent oxidoreductase (luciferase family)